MKKEIYVGIDIGYNNPSVCVLWDEHIFIHLPKIKDDGEMDFDFLHSILPVIPERRIIALIEDVHSFPKQGVVSTFKFGFSKGLFIGLCVSRGYEVYGISPQFWKSQYGLTSKSKKDSVLVAKTWCPEADWPKVDNHNAAEAFLLAKIAQKGTILLDRKIKTYKGA